jgi:hypothetical protein
MRMRYHCGIASGPMGESAIRPPLNYRCNPGPGILASKFVGPPVGPHRLPVQVEALEVAVERALQNEAAVADVRRKWRRLPGLPREASRHPLAPAGRPN